MVRSVYIYHDEGTSELGVQSLLTAVPQKLKLPAKTISAEQLIQNGLENAAALIIPGGADLPYCRKLNGEGNQIIKKYVEQGGNYIGICAGAYYACQQVEFIGQEYQVYGERELAFFNGIARGSLPEIAPLFNEKVASKAIVNLAISGEELPFYYHGGPAFIAHQACDVDVIFTFEPQKPAIIQGNYGKGYYLLSSVHFELQPEAYQKYVLNQCDNQDLKQERIIYRYLNSRYGEAIWQIIRQKM